MYKLKRRSQFQRVYREGRSYKENNIVLCKAANNTKDNRIGFSISLRSTFTNVNRNRSRRLLYESYRETENLLKKGYDVIFITKSDLSSLVLNNVKETLLKLYQKSRLLK